MTNVFLHGVLADERVLFLVTRLKTPVLESELRGYEATRDERRRPTLRPAAGRTVKGLVAVKVPKTFLDRVDGYYGPEYGTVEVDVNAGGREMRARAYVLYPNPEG